MATIVDNPDFSQARNGYVYPWHEWLDGQARRLIQGEDFIQDPLTFSRAAYSAARTRNVKVRIHKISPTTVLIQARRDAP